MKVAFLIKHINYSGAAKILAWLSSAFVNSGHTVSVITFCDKPPAYALSENIQQINMGESAKGAIGRAFFYIHQLKKIIRKGSFDIVFSFMPTESAYAVLAKTGKTKIVVCERSDPFSENGLHSRICRMVMNHSDGAVFQSEGAKSFFGRRLRKKSVVIPNPIFPSSKHSPLPLADRSKDILFVGRVENRQKRVTLFVDAAKASEAHEELKTYRFLVAGDGPDLGRLEDYARDLNPARPVVFLGARSDSLDLIAKSSLVIIPSKYEGIPNVMLEAMSVGTPILISPYSPGGVELYIEDGIDGIILQDQIDGEAIARDAARLLGDNRKWEELSNRSFGKTHLFSPEQVFKVWEEYATRVIVGK